MDIFQQLFSGVGTGRHSALQNVSDKTNASFMTPQPVGLTNVQSKIIGPYFTRNAVHRHPISKTPIESIRYSVVDFGAMYPISSDLPLQQAVAADNDDGREVERPPSSPTVHDVKSLADLVNMGFDVLPSTMTGIDYETSELARQLLMSMEDDDINAIINDPFKCAANKDTLEALGGDMLEPEQLQALFHVPAVVLRGTNSKYLAADYGFRIERGVSTLLTGSPCRFNVINDQLLRALRRREVLQVLVNVGIFSANDIIEAAPEDSSKSAEPSFNFLRTMLNVVGRGADPNTKMENAMYYLLANIFRRPVVLRRCGAVSGVGNTYVFVPKHVDLFEGGGPTSKTPFVFFNGEPVLWTTSSTDLPAVVVASPSTDAGFVFPQDTTLDEVAHKYIVANDDGNYCVARCAADKLLSPVSDPSRAVPDDPCSLYQEFDDKSGEEVLSFRSFPPCSFALADNKKQADKLLKAPGYGKDMSGAAEYLEDTLTAFENTALVDVDADGHCLLHAISRSLVGKEYLWHALRSALHRYMVQNKDKLKKVFEGTKAMACSDEELDSLIERAHPDHGSKDDMVSSARGLGCEHIFALSNMLKRPILLLDAATASHVESHVFLPLMSPPEEMLTKKFLAIGWSHQVHSHYVPLVKVNATMPALFPASSLPRGVDADGKPCDKVMVYGLPDGANSEDVLRVFFLTECTTDSAGVTKVLNPEPDAPLPKQYEIGGECELDINVWCHGHAVTFERTHSMSIWALHEFARYAVHSHPNPQKALSELGCVRDVSELEAKAVATLKSTPLAICPSCTTTRDSTKGICCYKELRSFDLQRGVYDFNRNDRTPLESDKVCNCCVFKHYLPNVMIGCGRHVFARDYCSNHQPAKILDVHLDGDDGHSDKEFFVYDPKSAAFEEKYGNTTLDVQFRNGIVRYGVPLREVSPGLFVDFAPRERALQSSATANGRRAPSASDSVIIQIDADAGLCSDPQFLLEDLVFKQTSGNDPKKLESNPIASQPLYKTKVLSEIRKHVTDIKATATRRNTLTSLDDAPLNDYDPVFHDEDGNGIMWEWYDGESYRSYEPAMIGGKIEAAFVAGEVSTVVEVTYIDQRFTIDFENMVQKNAMGYRRAIRRMAVKAWNCPMCTMENAAKEEWCATCRWQNISTPRPKDACVELDSYEKKQKETKAARNEMMEKMRQQLREAQAAEDEEDDRQLMELDDALEDKAADDEALRSGGALYNQAFKQAAKTSELDEQSPSKKHTDPNMATPPTSSATQPTRLPFPPISVMFPRSYGQDAPFIYFEAKDRFIPVPHIIPKAHKLYAKILSEGKRQSVRTGVYIMSNCLVWRNMYFMLDETNGTLSRFDI